MRLVDRIDRTTVVNIKDIDSKALMKASEEFYSQYGEWLDNVSAREALEVLISTICICISNGVLTLNELSTGVKE